MTEQGGEEQEGILGRLQNLKDNNSNNKSAPNEDLPQAETPRKLQKAKTAGELLKEKVTALDYTPPILEKNTSNPNIQPMIRRNKALDALERYKDANKPKPARSGIIRNDSYEYNPKPVLIGGDQTPDIAIVKTDSVPNIAPLPDEITPRIQATPIQKA